jgi:hypothetical protein
MPTSDYRMPLMLILLSLGCEQPSSSPTVSTTRGHPPANVVVPPLHPQVELFINNRKFGETNGCTTHFQPLAEADVEHSLTCGHPGAVSKVTWRYVSTDENGDHYRFRRTFPYDGPDPDTSRKDIIYNGMEQILFEDETQRILIRPSLD